MSTPVDGSPTEDAAINTTNVTGYFSGLMDSAAFISDADKFITSLLWLVNPASWLRIGSFMFGILLLLFAIYVFARVGSDQPLIPSVQPVPVPV